MAESPARPTIDAALGRSAPLRPTGGVRARATAALLASAHHVVAGGLNQPGPFAGLDEAPWLADLEQAYPAIRAEHDAVLARGLRAVPMSMITDDDMALDGSWGATMLRDHAGWIEPNVARFPRTTEVLRAIPGLRTALFSILAPGSTISPHRGPTNGVLRGHLGLVVPGPPGACALRVGAERRAWEEGQAFAFDDSWEHAAHNRTDEPRTSLMVEVERPLPGWRAPLNRANLRLLRLHPHARGSHQRILEADAALNRSPPSHPGER